MSDGRWELLLQKEHSKESKHDIICWNCVLILMNQFVILICITETFYYFFSCLFPY